MPCYTLVTLCPPGCYVSMPYISDTLPNRVLCLRICYRKKPYLGDTLPNEMQYINMYVVASECFVLQACRYTDNIEMFPNFL